jgi:hypothetical protein
MWGGSMMMPMILCMCNITGCDDVIVLDDIAHDDVNALNDVCAWNVA